MSQLLRLLGLCLILAGATQYQQAKSGNNVDALIDEFGACENVLDKYMYMHHCLLFVHSSSGAACNSL